ncbi:MAG: DNA-processing protein DprA [Peptococcaceae bacterium]|nr:DNA-processing protein DprA [Peptococcaceae bacterium]
MDERGYFLAWQITLPGSAKRVWHLIELFGSAGNAWKATEKQLINIGGFAAGDARELVLRRRGVNPEAEMSLLEKKGITFLHFGDPGYPEILRNIFDPPPGLFVKGEIKQSDSQAVALVGSRKATRYGIAAAAKLAGELAGAGVTVVSGMARGIDTAAHRGALAAGGRTIAVLGCGLDVAYPRENAGLMEEIARSGAVVSEFPLGTPPEAWHFPVRNRIISGLSRGVVVVEAASRSGALITADFALDQGREVMAVPGNITSEVSRGPNRLIRQGARPVESAGDILEDLGLERLFGAEDREAPRINLSPEEEAVRKIISSEPAALDDLIDRSGLPAQKVLAALTFLEMKGVVRQLPGKLYTISPRR